MEKGKRKGIGVPVTRSFFYLFLSHSEKPSGQFLGLIVMSH
jgi:hypothetical protein